MKKLIIVGNTSNAKLAHYYFTHDSEYEVAGFSVDREYMLDAFFCNLPVVPLEDLNKTFPTNKFDVFVAVGYTNMNIVREKLYNRVKELGYFLPNYISSKCSFLTNEKIGDNNFILEDNTIQPFVKIGNNNVLWSGNHIGHDAHIKNNCFITSHVVISGFTSISDNCFLGVNSTFRDDIILGKYSLIGAGAVIMSNTEEKSVYLATKPFKMNKLSTDLKI